MINPSYCVKCLRIGFEAYKRLCKLPIYIKPSKTTVSFYVKKPMMQKGKDVRVSTHHPSLEKYADDRNTPWLFDNVSIEFIVPNSEEDKETLRARVYQNASGTIQSFNVTVYQYDSTSINVRLT